MKWYNNNNKKSLPEYFQGPAPWAVDEVSEVWELKTVCQENFKRDGGTIEEANMTLHPKYFIILTIL